MADLDNSQRIASIESFILKSTPSFGPLGVSVLQSEAVDGYDIIYESEKTEYGVYDGNLDEYLVSDGIETATINQH